MFMLDDRTSAGHWSENDGNIYDDPNLKMAAFDFRILSLKANKGPQ